MMREWKEVKLKSIVSDFFDGPHATPKESEHGAVFLGIKNITEDGRIDLSDIRYIALEDMPKWTKRVTPSEGDIVFSYEATLNRYAIIPKGFHGCLGRRMALIRVNENFADKKFVFQYMFSPAWRKEVERNIMTGATVDRIPLTNVPDFNVSLPPLPTQRRIASILYAYDDLIENNLKRIKLLEELAQRTYEEWFVKFRVNGVELAVMEETGLPEGWGKKKLSDVAYLTMGQSPKSEFYNIAAAGLPFHQGVTDYGFRFPANSKWSTEGSRYAEKGDILFSVRAPVGRLNIAIEKIILGRGLSSIRDKDGFNSFLFYQLQNIFFKDDLMGGGSIFNSVTKTDVERIEITFPNEKERRSFEDFGSAVDKQIEVLTKQNINLKQSRDILLPRLMSGEMEV